MDEPIKSLSHSDGNNLKVGDKVFVGDMEQVEWKGEGCPLCHVPTDEEIKAGVLTTWEPGDLCYMHGEFDGLETENPKLQQACMSDAPVILINQSAYGTSVNEVITLGLAIKYLGEHGKVVQIVPNHVASNK